MNICVVSRGDIFPPNHGAAVKLYYTMTSLSKKNNVNIFFVSDDNKSYFYVEDGEFFEKEYPAFLTKLLENEELYKKIVIWLGVPEEDWILYRPVVDVNMWLRTLFVTLKENIDVLQSEFPGFSIPSIFSKLFSFVNISTVEHNIEYFRVQETSSSISVGGLKFYKLIEKIMGIFSDWVITVSEEDRNRAELLGINNVEIIPHGVDIDRFAVGNGDWVRKKHGISSDETVLIFHGVLNYSPNREAVFYIVDDILPKLSTNKNIKVIIVGGYPPEIDDVPESVVFTGFVDRLADYLDAADIAIVPLKAGGGTRLKVLEYFASKTPVISTKKGVEGLNVINNKEVLISEIPDIGDKVKELMDNETLYNSLQKNAFEHVEKLDWSNIAEKYKNLYDNY